MGPSEKSFLEKNQRVSRVVESLPKRTIFLGLFQPLCSFAKENCAFTAFKIHEIPWPLQLDFIIPMNDLVLTFLLFQ